MNTTSNSFKRAFNIVRPRRSVFIVMGLLWFLVIQYYARILLSLTDDNLLFSTLDTLLDAFLTPQYVFLRAVANPVVWGDLAQISVILVYSYLLAVLLAGLGESAVNQV